MKESPPPPVLPPPGVFVSVLGNLSESSVLLSSRKNSRLSSLRRTPCLRKFRLGGEGRREEGGTEREGGGIQRERATERERKRGGEAECQSEESLLCWVFSARHQLIHIQIELLNGRLHPLHSNSHARTHTHTHFWHYSCKDIALISIHCGRPNP